jgi:hypothetical protein
MLYIYIPGATLLPDLFRLFHTIDCLPPALSSSSSVITSTATLPASGRLNVMVVVGLNGFGYAYALKKLLAAIPKAFFVKDELGYFLRNDKEYRYFNFHFFLM